MKKFTALFLTVMMVFALVAGAAPTAHAANPIHLKLSHPASEGQHYDLMSKEFARLIEEKTDGRYVIDILLPTRSVHRKKSLTLYRSVLWSLLLHLMISLQNMLPTGAISACPTSLMTSMTLMKT